jgi:hypothetical protein
VDTGALQAVAAGSFGALHLDVCRVAWPDQQLSIDASVPASLPDTSGAGSAAWDRRDCSAWTLRPDDEPVVLTAQVTGAGPDVPAPRSTSLVCSPAPGLDRDAVVTGPIAFARTRLRARASGAPGTSAGLVAETFVYVRVGNRAELLVPRAWQGRLSLGNRNGPRATSRAIASCAASPGSAGWSAIPISVGVDAPACVPILVKTGTRTRTAHLGIGTACGSGAGGR